MFHKTLSAGVISWETLPLLQNGKLLPQGQVLQEQITT
jgi:hypothetical protein